MKIILKLLIIDASFNLYYKKGIQNPQIITKMQIKYENDYDLIMNKLNKLKNIEIFKSNLYQNSDGKYYAKDNIGIIRDTLDLDNFSMIDPDLTFTNQLIQNQTNRIEVSYKGIDQGFRIPIYVL